MVCTYHSKSESVEFVVTILVFYQDKLLTEILVRQGFWYNKLCITFKKSARRYGVSIRTHVTEGICIPLVAKPDLIRNVTICGCGRVRSRLLLGTIQ